MAFSLNTPLDTGQVKIPPFGNFIARSREKWTKRFRRMSHWIYMSERKFIFFCPTVERLLSHCRASSVPLSSVFCPTVERLLSHCRTQLILYFICFICEQCALSTAVTHSNRPRYRRGAISAFGNGGAKSCLTSRRITLTSLQFFCRRNTVVSRLEYNVIESILMLKRFHDFIRMLFYPSDT